MTMPTPPRRFRFGLRTLFVLVTVAAAGCAWVAYSLNWIRERHDMAARSYSSQSTEARLAPGGLWLFGEAGVCDLLVADQDFERAKDLFPETEVWCGHDIQDVREN